MEKSTILIIGGSGFIGSYIAKSLINKDYSVIATYRTKPQPVEMVDGVVYREKFNLEPELIGNIQTVIFAPRPDDPATVVEAFNCFNRLPKLEKIIYLSTFGLYPDSLEKQTESAEVVLISEYQKNKYAEEISFTEFSQKQNVKLCIARISNPYGDVQDKQLIGKILKQFEYEKEDFKLNGDGSQLKDFIFIEDTAELISFLVEYRQETAYEIFNICSSEGHSVNEVISVLENLLGKKLVFKQTALPEGEKINSIGDNTKIITASKYHIRYTLTDGLKKTLEKYAQNS